MVAWNKTTLKTNIGIFPINEINRISVYKDSVLKRIFNTCYFSSCQFQTQKKPALSSFKWIEPCNLGEIQQLAKNKHHNEQVRQNSLLHTLFFDGGGAQRQGGGGLLDLYLQYNTIIFKHFLSKLKYFDGKKYFILFPDINNISLDHKICVQL